MNCRTDRKDVRCVFNFIKWLKQQEIFGSRARKMEAKTERK